MNINMQKYLAIIDAFLIKSFKSLPLNIDFKILSIFTIFITLQPYYLHRAVDYFELAIYLPGINALMDGLLPYRDFFHLRGPLEIYVPAFLMHFFGKNIAVLCTYFYVGNVLNLILWILLGKKVFKSRIILYAMSMILVARTFPRVVFQLWGGMRFALGALSLFFFIKYINKKKPIWLMLSGGVTSLALLTSIEIGIFNLFSVLGVIIFSWFFNIQEKNTVKNELKYYILGVGIILLPYCSYLWATSSFFPFIDSILSVLTNMYKTFPDYLFEDHPQSLLDIFLSLNPASKHFKHLTPAYCYIFFISYLIFRLKNKKFKEADLGILSIFLYGMIMYILSFRKIGAAQFEMALQPEKILLFFMLEKFFRILIDKKNNFISVQEKTAIRKLKKKISIKIIFINALIFSFFASSLGYALARYDKRFFTYKYVKNLILRKDVRELKPEEDLVRVKIPSAKGLAIPQWQADDFTQLTNFVNKNTKKGEKIFTFPELGIYNFIVDRPFVGRFPIVIFSWFNEKWEDELFEDLKSTKPTFAILPKKLDPVFEKVYFKVEKNKSSFEKFSHYIHNHYTLIGSTHTLLIYKKQN